MYFKASTDTNLILVGKNIKICMLSVLERVIITFFFPKKMILKIGEGC